MTGTELLTHIPGLRRYARVLTGDAWAADDLVQDTLERACTKWRWWSVGSNLRAWLFSIMHNLFVDAVRRDSIQTRSKLVQVDDVAHELFAPAGQHDQMLDLERCLLRLPADQRAVLLLVSLEEMSYAEVAKITGVPIGTVMSRLSRARERLQTLMNAPAEPVHAVTQITPVFRRLK